MATVERPLRRDAERNRQRILDAAQELFTERGLGVTLNDIAHHAEVGVGTVYRRFPDKQQLIDALFDERIGEIVTLAEEGLADPDPWQGLTGFLERGLDLQACNRGLKELLEDSGDIEVVGEAGTAVEARSGIPLAEPDVAVLDVRLSDGSGVEVCREIRSRHPEIKCVMFSAFDDEVAIVESILAGASGYVLKQIKGGDIVNALASASGLQSGGPERVADRVEDLVAGPVAHPQPDHL